MTQVSVGQVENIEDAVWALQSAYDAMESACAAEIAAARSRMAEAQNAADECAMEFNLAVDAEREAQSRLERARNRLSSAQNRLFSARSSLAACQASGSYDTEGNYEPPDCSSEEAEADAAESAAEEASEAVCAAEESFISAKEYRMAKEQRNELARHCLSVATQVAETVQAECAARLARAASLVETGKARLRQAQEALNAYLESNPQAAEFHSWIKWSPEPNLAITPADLHARLNLSTEKQRYFFEYLSDRDPAFRAKVAMYREQLGAARGPAEKHAVQLKMRRNLSGYYGEKVVEQAFSPLGGKVEAQAQHVFEDGKSTRTDLIVKNLKVPVVLGRGEGMGARAGGSIAVEVKCGKASYLYSEKDHMVFQSAGHQSSTASVTICSRDIKDLTPEQEAALREALREAGSPIIGMLPRKDEIDRACWQMVSGFDPNEGGNRED